MKIDDRSDLNGVAASAAKGAASVEGAARQQAGRKAERTGSDRAELSGLAGKISRAASQDADDRAANVERLRLEVANGTYQPDPADISRGVVKDAVASAAAVGESRQK